MWSRKVLLATMVAAAAVMMMRHNAPTAPGYAHAHSIVATSFR
jgi:hypothetical protein